MSYTYQISRIEPPANETQIIEWLNSLSKDGWDLVCQNLSTDYLFKKKV